MVSDSYMNVCIHYFTSIKWDPNCIFSIKMLLNFHIIMVYLIFLKIISEKFEIKAKHL